MIVEIRDCPSCTSGEVEPLFVVDDYHIDLCRVCTLQFVRERPTADELSTYYDNQLLDPVYADPSHGENLRFYYRLLRGRIEAEVPKGRILDVGCAAGWFLDEMHGWEVFGCEVSAELAEMARQRHGAAIHQGFLEDVDLGKTNFDVITLQDVLDHARDPLAMLRLCNSKLNDGGLLIVKVHDVSCLYARLAGSHFYAYTPPGHLSYFNRRSLGMALSATGFHPIRYEHLPHLLFVSTVFLRLAQGRAGFWRDMHSRFHGRRLGQLRIKKNLHDIVTVVARKR